MENLFKFFFLHVMEMKSDTEIAMFLLDVCVNAICIEGLNCFKGQLYKTSQLTLFFIT